jgi:hypothetical protein
VVMDDLGFSRAALEQPFQCLLDREGHCIRRHRQVQTPVDQEAAVSIQDIHQVVVAGLDVQVHDVHVPHLVRVVRFRRSLQGLGD